MEIESIDSKEKLLINSSKTTRYLGYPRKVPLWKLFFSLPKAIRVSAWIYNESFSRMLTEIALFVIIAESFDLKISPKWPFIIDLFSVSVIFTLLVAEA